MLFKKLNRRVKREKSIPTMDELINQAEHINERPIHKFNSYEWKRVCSSLELNDEFIELYIDKVDWEIISSQQKLSESFIRKHQDKVDWYDISLCQNLSEEFIEEFQSKVSWWAITINQNFSFEFAMKHIDKIYLDKLLEFCSYKGYTTEQINMLNDMVRLRVFG